MLAFIGRLHVLSLSRARAVWQLLSRLKTGADAFNNIACDAQRKANASTHDCWDGATVLPHLASSVRTLVLQNAWDELQLHDILCLPLSRCPSAYLRDYRAANGVDFESTIKKADSRDAQSPLSGRRLQEGTFEIKFGKDNE